MTKTYNTMSEVDGIKTIFMISAPVQEVIKVLSAGIRNKDNAQILLESETRIIVGLKTSALSSIKFVFWLEEEIKKVKEEVKTDELISVATYSISEGFNIRF